MKYKKKYRGIPRDVKVWVFAQDYGNRTARVLEMTFGEAIDHEYDWDDIYFIKRIAEERLKKFEEAK